MTFEKWIEEYPNLNDFERDLAKKAFTEGKNENNNLTYRDVYVQHLEEENKELKKLCQEKDKSNDDLTMRIVELSEKIFRVQSGE